MEYLTEIRKRVLPETFETMFAFAFGGEDQASIPAPSILKKRKNRYGDSGLRRIAQLSFQKEWWKYPPIGTKNAGP